MLLNKNDIGRHVDSFDSAQANSLKQKQMLVQVDALDSASI